MHDLGIMQGRIYPDRLDKLQVFPTQYWKTEFTKAKEIGFNYIELLYDREEQKSNPLVEGSRLGDILAAARQNNLKIYSLCADYFTSYNFCDSPNEQTWGKLSYLVDIASQLGVKTVVLPFFDQNDLENISQLRQFLLEAEVQLPQLHKKKVTLCIETTLSAEEMYYAIKGTHSLVKVCYDLGNATAFGFDPECEILFLGNYIGLVHIKDRKKNGGPNVLLGDGDVDFRSCFMALKEKNYKGNFTLETAIGNEPERIAQRHFEMMKKIIEFLI